MESIHSISVDIRNDQKLIEVSMNTNSLCRDKAVQQFLQKRLDHLNKQISLESEYISVKVSHEFEEIRSAKQSKLIYFISNYFESSYKLFGMDL